MKQRRCAALGRRRSDATEGNVEADAIRGRGANVGMFGDKFGAARGVYDDRGPARRERGRGGGGAGGGGSRSGLVEDRRGLARVELELPLPAEATSPIVSSMNVCIQMWIDLPVCYLRVQHNIQVDET